MFCFVADGPTFREKPRSIESDIGSIVTLNCEVDGNPTPDIVWIQHPIDRVSLLALRVTFKALILILFSHLALFFKGCWFQLEFDIQC